jgi:hypothetical protein
MAQRLVRVKKLSGTVRYGTPRKAYGPGTNILVPHGLARSLGISFEELSEEEQAGKSGAPSGASVVSGTVAVPSKGSTEAEPMGAALGISEAQAAALAEAGYDTAEALEAASDEDLMEVDGIGKATVKKIRDGLKG